MRAALYRRSASERMSRSGSFSNLGVLSVRSQIPPAWISGQRDRTREEYSIAAAGQERYLRPSPRANARNSYRFALRTMRNSLDHACRTAWAMPEVCIRAALLQAMHVL